MQARMASSFHGWPGEQRLRGSVAGDCRSAECVMPYPEKYTEILWPKARLTVSWSADVAAISSVIRGTTSDSERLSVASASMRCRWRTVILGLSGHFTASIYQDEEGNAQNFSTCIRIPWTMACWGVQIMLEIPSREVLNRIGLTAEPTQ